MKVIVRKSNPFGEFLQIVSLPDEDDIFSFTYLQTRCNHSKAEKLCGALQTILNKDRDKAVKNIQIETLLLSQEKDDLFTIDNKLTIVSLNYKAAKNLMYEIKRLYKIK